MAESSGIKPFLCDTIDKAVIRSEWQKWVRALQLYLDSENIQDCLKKRNKLLHLGGMQLQEVAYNIPGAIVQYDTEEQNDVFGILVDALTKYFSPVQNSTFERHTFRNLKPETGEDLKKFLLRLRKQAAKCSFGNTAEEAMELNIKDKLIDNWAPLELKRQLLEKERTLSEVIDLCQIHEQIKDQASEMSTTTTASTSGVSVNRVVTQTQRFDQSCYRCGSMKHSGNDTRCPARLQACKKCDMRGHFARRCRTKQKKRPYSGNDAAESKKKRTTSSRVNYINSEESEDGEHDDGRNIKEFSCFKVLQEGDRHDSYQDEFLESKVGGVPIKLLIDSGSKANIINGQDWDLLTKKGAVVWHIDVHAKNTLKPYAVGQSLEVRHKFQTTVSAANQKEIITSFFVVDRGDVSILGKDAAKQLGVLKLGVGINRVIENTSPFPKIKGVKVKLSIDTSVKPVQQPLRRVPVAIEAAVGNKIKEAVQRDIIEPVTGYSPWISPIVITYKSNGDIRICVDMRRANEAIRRENYPLPTFESIMTKLGNAKYFSRLDLEWAYHQIELDIESREITTFITHKGMFRYKRLMFGVTSAPEIFQRIFENLLAQCKNCLNYLDDIIIYGQTEEEHDTSRRKVMEVFRKYNVLLNKSKCTERTQELQFLGHRLSSNGIDADQDKVQTIQNFRAPATKEELRSFLGLVTYLGRFIPDLGTTTEPLRQLIKKDVKFSWNQEHQIAFDKLKKELTKPPTLTYFDTSKRTRLIADASPVALGAVLIQFHGTVPKVISYASKGLSDSERRYSQTEKESLALVWAVERFYFYLTGLEFELVTDHKPLEAIFKPTSRPPARIERWVLRLQSFKFKVIYETGKSNIADSVSRLCQLHNVGSFDRAGDHHIFTVIQHSIPKAMSISEITAESERDTGIMYAIDKTNGDSWNSKDTSSYFPFRFELTTLGPILLRNNRITIPICLRPRVLQLAHEGHPGINVMKRRLRAKVWWPGIDKEVEQFVKNCKDCLLVSQPERPPPMTRHRFPEGPWQYLAIDLMGPLPNQEQILVVIDYYSRYQDIQFLRSTTSAVIVNHLSDLFSRLGIPRTIRADNGKQFTSREFKNFCEENGIRLIHTPPYWPQANGEVENMNKSVLKRLQICQNNNQDYKAEIKKFILMYNVTPHGTTGKSPTELLFNRRIRDKIPDINDIRGEDGDQEAHDTDLVNKERGKRQEDSTRRAKVGTIGVGDKVVAQNVVIPHKLTSRFNEAEYVVTEKNGNEVTLVGNGKTMKRHISHVKKIPSTPTSSPQSPSNQIPESATNENEDARRAEAASGQEESQPETTGRIEPLKLKRRDGMWERSD